MLYLIIFVLACTNQLSKNSKSGYVSALTYSFPIAWFLVCIVSASSVVLSNYLGSLHLAQYINVGLSLGALLTLYRFSPKLPLITAGLDEPLNIWGKLALGILTLMVVTTFAAGLLLPPNNWDSMTYHLSRILYWEQLDQIRYFPTSNPRVLYQPPLSELIAFIGYQTDGQSDRLLFMIQWLSYLSYLCLVLNLCSRFKIGINKSLIVTALCGSMPMLVLQASSTQNDLLLGFFCLLGAFMFLNGANNKNGFEIGLGMAALLGAIFTKGTGTIWVASIGLSILIMTRKSLPWQLVIKTGILVLVGFGLLSGWFYKANYEATGSLLGTPATEYSMYANQNHAVGGIMNNLARNVSMHLGVLGPVPYLNPVVKWIIEHITGVSVNDPAYTFDKQQFIISGSTHEDTAVMLIALLAIIATISISVAKYQLKPNPAYLIWFLAPSIGLLLFSFLLKWQPWHSRLHLPLFMMAMPAVFSLLLQHIYQVKNLKLRQSFQVILIILAATGLFFILKNDRRQLGNPKHWAASGYEAYYAVDKHDHFLELDTIKTIINLDAPTLNNQPVIGLMIDGDQWDYPLKKEWQQEKRWITMPVANLGYTSKFKPVADLRPDYILIDSCALPQYKTLIPKLGKRIKFKGTIFSLMAFNEPDQRRLGIINYLESQSMREQERNKKAPQP